MVTLLQRVTDLPLQIDCTKPDAIEAALRAYHGKAIVNSVSGDDDSLDGILPVAAKYGAAIVALCVDKNGVPETVEDRLRIARKIISAAKKYGIPEQDIFVDCLTLTVGAQQEQAVRTLEAIRRIKSEYDVRTVLGVSNISFGLPERKAINTAFLSAALWAGLDAPILNPNIPENMQAVAAFKALCGEDVNCAEYTAKYSAAPKAETASSDESSADLAYLIRKGLPTAQAKAAAMLDGGIAPLELVNSHLIPALNSVGDDYEKGTLFLPQLIAAADAAKLCFDEIKKRMPESSVKGDTIVLATVEGDVHDIGKNIVKTVLANYGYDVVDLGKNVRHGRRRGADRRLCPQDRRGLLLQRRRRGRAHRRPHLQGRAARPAPPQGLTPQCSTASATVDIAPPRRYNGPVLDRGRLDRTNGTQLLPSSRQQTDLTDSDKPFSFNTKK